MTKQEKGVIIEDLTGKFNEVNSFYVTDSSTLTVEEVNNLRRICFEKGVEMRMAKNTLIKKALEAADGNYEDLYDILVGTSTLMFSEVTNSPAKVLKDFRKSHEKPTLKAAFIDADVFKGDDQIDVLSKLKSKEELIGEVLVLLQSPMKNVISGLQSASGSKIHGLLQTLSEREG